MLHAREVTKAFHNGVVALRDVTLTVAAGEILTIVGGSGCGKSTLLRLLAGLDRPSSGTISIDGSPVHEPHPKIGLIFQEPRLLPWLTVAENVAFGLSHLPSKERDTRVAEVLSQVGLAEYGRRWPKELSGGQGQRVAIARALVTKPDVLLLDEPFSALDAFTRAELQQHLVELWRKSRPTLILVTHDIEEAVALGTRVVVMASNPGRIGRAIDVHLAHPGDRYSLDFEKEKLRILEALDENRVSSKERAKASA